MQLRYLPLLALSLFSNASDKVPLNDISSLRWENRLIIVNQPTNPDNALSLMKNHTQDIIERDIVWFILKGSEAVTNYSGSLSKLLMENIRQEYGLKRNTVTLIGKDGGIKSQKNSVDLQILFSTIDAMPMRQQEMHLK